MKKALLIAALVLGAIGIANTAAATYNPSYSLDVPNIQCGDTEWSASTGQAVVPCQTTTTTTTPAAPTTTPTTTQPPAATTSTTEAPPVASTSTVAPAAPANTVKPPAATPKVNPTPTQLPSTGFDDLVLALVALAFTLVGISALVAARRKTARR